MNSNRSRDKQSHMDRTGEMDVRDEAQQCACVSVGVVGGWHHSNTKSPGQELTLCTVSRPASHCGPHRTGMRPQCEDKLCHLHNYTEGGLTASPAKPAGIAVLLIEKKDITRYVFLMCNFNRCYYS